VKSSINPWILFHAILITLLSYPCDICLFIINVTCFKIYHLRKHIITFGLTKHFFDNIVLSCQRGWHVIFCVFWLITVCINLLLVIIAFQCISTGRTSNLLRSLDYLLFVTNKYIKNLKYIKRPEHFPSHFE